MKLLKVLIGNILETRLIRVDDFNDQFNRSNGFYLIEILFKNFYNFKNLFKHNKTFKF